MRADWHVPYDRAAKAHAMLGNWKRAVDFCRGGERAASARARGCGGGGVRDAA